MHTTAILVLMFWDRRGVASVDILTTGFTEGMPLAQTVA
jgi:hypothetical protein